ncbi:hypothetical protein ACVDG8_007460 [Mesorhizobium sp. ORM8.1]
MSTTGHLSDAISAASLVLAVLAALYTLWLPEVSAALGITSEADPDNRGPQRSRVKIAMFTKALPLAVATVLEAFILLPRGIAIICEAWTRRSDWYFDDVKAFFVLTFMLLLLLAFVAFTQFIRLIAKWVALNKR